MKIGKSLIALDIESTGVWVEKDKIIEIALIKFVPDAGKETLHTKINPGMPIPPAITKLTGISEQDVKGAPYFRDVAGKIYDFIGTSDLAGFNLEKFDLPVLQRELAEAGYRFEWEDRKIYDAQKVYHINEKRDLSAAYQFYCGKELKGAHSALADTEAVYEILEQQVNRYGEGREDISVLDKFEYSSHIEYYDSDKKFCWWNGKLYPAFGKYRRQASIDEIAKQDPGYLKWLLKSDFREEVKELIQGVLKGQLPTRP